MRVLEPRWVAGREQLAQPQGHGLQPLGVEGGQFELRLAQAGEPALLQEPDAVVQRGQSSHALAGVEELRRAGEDPEQPGVRAGGIGDLANAVQRLVPRVLPHPQDRLGLVDDDDQPGVAGGLDDLQHAAQVVQRVAAADVALDAGQPSWPTPRRCRCRTATRSAPRPPRPRRAASDRRSSARRGRSPAGPCPPVRVARSSSSRCRTRSSKSVGVLVHPGRDQLLLDRADPAVQDVAQRPARAGRRCSARSPPCGTRRRSGGSADRCPTPRRSWWRSPGPGRRAAASRAMKVLPQP